MSDTPQPKEKPAAAAKPSEESKQVVAGGKSQVENSGNSVSDTPELKETSAEQDDSTGKEGPGEKSKQAAVAEEPKAEKPAALEPPKDKPAAEDKAAAEDKPPAEAKPSEESRQAAVAEEPQAEKPAAKEPPKDKPAAKEKPAARAKPAPKAKPPKPEDKPFPEFIDTLFIPAVEKQLQENSIKPERLERVADSRPVVGGECPMVLGELPGGRRFWVCFAQENINSPKHIALAEPGSEPTLLESFLIDEKRMTLPLLVSRLLQRLNGQKWLGRN